MQPAGHTFAPSQPKCQIFQSVNLYPIGSILNLTFSVSTRFEISHSQAWRSLRLRVSGAGGREVLRSKDSFSSGIINKTHSFVSFITGIAGSATIDVFCSDQPLSSFESELPNAPSPDFKQTFLGLGWIGPVCLWNGKFELFTKRAVAPAVIRGWKPVFTAELFEGREGEVSKAAQFHVLSYGKFVGDLVAPAFLAATRDARALMLLYGDRQLAADIAAVHSRFRHRENVSMCVRRFEYGKELKEIGDFDAVDFAEVRAILPMPKGGHRKVMVVELEGKPLVFVGDRVDGFEKVEIEGMRATVVPYVFTDVNWVIVPFQAPIGLLAFLRPFAKVIVVRPEGFWCSSNLERKLAVGGLPFEIINGTVTSSEECDQTCECVKNVKYQVNIEKIQGVIG